MAEATHRVVLDVPESIWIKMHGNRLTRHRSLKAWMLEAIMVKVEAEERTKTLTTPTTPEEVG